MLLQQTLNLAKLPGGKSGAARQGDIFEPEFGRSRSPHAYAAIRVVHGCKNITASHGCVKRSALCHGPQTQTNGGPVLVHDGVGQPRSCREDLDERDERSQNDNGLEAQGSHDPFVHVVLQSGNFVLELDLEPGDIRFELGPYLGNIGL